MPEDPSSIWETVAAHPLAIAVRESLWAYPILETIHIIGLALIFGSVLAFDLRVLGLNRGLPLDLLARHLLPWVWLGFAANILTGALMFVSDAAEFQANPAFQAKLVLLMLAGANAAFFHRRVCALYHAQPIMVPLPVHAKVSAALSIVLWIAVITAGRMMAYVA